MAVAVALQQVGYSWFAFYRGAGRVLAAGRRVRRRSVPRSRCSPCRARCSAGRGASWRAGSGARRACCWCGACTCAGCCLERGCSGWRCGRRCRWRSRRRRCWRCGRAVGRGAAGLAGAAGARPVAGRLGAGDAPARGRPGVRAARLPARGRRAGVSRSLREGRAAWRRARASTYTTPGCATRRSRAGSLSPRSARPRERGGREARGVVARGGGRLRLHAAPLSRAARRGHPDAGRDADGATGSGRGATSAGPTGRGSRWS